jgi:starvation-inducible DNA-binding protein
MDHILDDGHKPKLPGYIQPNIGIESDIRSLIVEILNKTLANESVLTIKTRSAHWNIKGPSYFEFHILFGSQFEQLNKISDEIAERARILGGSAIGSLQEFMKYSQLDENPGEIPDTLVLLADHENIIRNLREDAKKVSDEYEDEGSFELLVGIMRLHEKMAWMLRSYIEGEPVYKVYVEKTAERIDQPIKSEKKETDSIIPVNKGEQHGT